MTPDRRTALIAGIFYLITFVSSILAVLLIAPVLNEVNYIVSSGADARVITGCLLDLVNAIACVGTAVTLFPVTRRQNEALALGFVASRLFEMAVIMIGVVCLLAVVALRQPGGNQSLLGIGQALVAVRNETFLLGPGLAPGFNALLLGYLFFRSRLVPRWMPIVGLIGAPLIILSVIARAYAANEFITVFAGIATVPIFVWELSIGLWMAIKGFRPSALHEPEQKQVVAA